MSKFKELRDRMSTRIQALARGMKGRARFNRLAPMLRKENAMRDMCSECEVKKATRKCTQCRDRFCEVCFIKMHKKGFRKTHSYTPLGKVGPGGVVVVEEEATLDDGNAMNTSMNGTVKGGRNNQRGGKNTQQNTKVTAGGKKNPKDQWKEYFDKEAGAKYWHNEETGEAVWTKPY
jgi:hypothetical protein